MKAKFLEAIVKKINNTFYNEAFAQGEKDDYKFRRMSNSNSERDLLPLEYEKALRLSYNLWQRNPLAQRIIQLMKDYLVGEEFKIEVKIMRTVKGKADEETENKSAENIWIEFYENPQNNLEQELDGYIIDLLLNGELILPVTVNAVNGAVLLGYIDALNVKEVIPDAQNGKIIRKIICRNGVDEHAYNVVNYDSDVKSKTFGKLVGEVLYFRINRIAGQVRGTGELVALIDWLDGLDQFLFNGLSGAILRNSFFYDITVDGASAQRIKELRQEIQTPVPGETIIHNEKMKWQAITPELKSAELSEATRLFKNLVLGAKGFPEHWFADGGNTNLATATEMSTPIMRTLKAKQKEVRGILKQLVYFVIDQAIIHKRLVLQSNEYVRCQISMFDFERRDADVMGSAFNQVVSALSVAADKHWLSNNTAKKIVDGIVERFGVEINEYESYENIKASADEGESIDIYAGTPQGIIG